MKLKLSELTDAQFKIFTHYRHYGDNFIFVNAGHYERCGFRCLYCIAESQGKTRPILPDLDSFQRQLALELDAFASDSYMFCFGGDTDAYNEIEPEYRYTRHMLDEMTRRDRRFLLSTKSPLILRDTDLFLRNPKSNRQIATLSISASRAELLADLEPQAPPPEARIEAVHQLAASGVNIGVQISPWLPDITDTDRLLSMLPKGILIYLQPLDLGDAYQKTHDNKRRVSSARRAFGNQWDQNYINRAYIHECNTVGRKYKKDFTMEWRYPVSHKTHSDMMYYLKKMPPGKYDPDQWVQEHWVEPRIPVANE